MARFNLICHGMFLIVEIGDNILIVLPEIVGSHHLMHGNPVNVRGCVAVPDGNTISPDEAYSLKISGYTGQSKKLSTLWQGAGGFNLFLHGSVKGDASRGIKYVPYENGRRKRVEITAPKPSSMRFFRAAEPKAGYGVLGDEDPEFAFPVKETFYDTLCLTYNFDPPALSNVIMESQDGRRLVELSVLDKLSYCLYSQPGKNDHQDESQENGAFNELIVEKLSGRPPTFNVAAFGKTDLPGEPAPDTGISICHLYHLNELAAIQQGKSPKERFTDESGCPPTFLEL